MARPTLDNHPKFRRLMHLLGETRAHVRGHLELLWEVSYETGNPRIGDATDIELAADWQGEPGKFCSAAADCGGEGRAGLIEEIEGEPGRFQIHDLYVHAPEYVRKRMDRELARQKAGKTLSQIRSEAAYSRWEQQDDQPETGGANGCKRKSLATSEDANGTPPAPAHAHAQLSDWLIRRADHSEAWEEARRNAEEVEKRFWSRKAKKDIDPAGRRLILRLCFIAPGIGEGWLADGVNGTKTATGVRDHSAYLKKILANSAKAKGIDLNKILDQIEIPDKEPRNGDGLAAIAAAAERVKAVPSSETGP
jgi:hypothetical protein